MPTVFIVVAAVLVLICAFAESKVTGVNKAFGAYGRLRAFLFTDFLLLGITSVVTAFVMEKPILGTKTVSILGGLGFVVLAVLIFIVTLSKCPSMLKGKLFFNMLISGLGVSAKLAVCFIVAVWTLSGPKVVTANDGRTYYQYGHDLYTPEGQRVGNTNPSGGYNVMKDENGNPVHTDQNL